MFRMYIIGSAHPQGDHQSLESKEPFGLKVYEQIGCYDCRGAHDKVRHENVADFKE